MADSTLTERLSKHAASFDGLLSLIPAKHYYGQDDTSDQWKKKKQTKAEAAAARRAKLDPASAKSAKDVMDERARKRKLEEAELEGPEESDIEGVEKELPRQGLKQAQDPKSKKQKTSNVANSKEVETPVDAKAANDASKAAKLEQKRLKAEKKKEQKAKKVEKIKAKRANASEPEPVAKISTDEEEVEVPPVATVEVEQDTEMDEDLPGDEVAPFDAEGLEEDKPTTTSNSPSPILDQPSEPSTNTSTSSVVPPTKAPKHFKLPTDPELLRARLAARIEALRAARKADGPDGAPARNRQELLEGRRKKEEQRRAVKKELRNKARIEEEAQREAALASARNSPASSFGMMSPQDNSADNNFSFGRVAFADGQQMNEDLTALKAAPRKKGPQDAASALAASEKKRLRLSGLDSEKQADISEKELWLNAKKRAHGEKVRDDSSLLKKTLKRKEKAKKKSEKEWGERKEGIAKGQAMKQKKRTENLQKRKDESKKGKAKAKASGKPVGSKKPKVKSRPGFEGGGIGGKRK